MFLAAAAIAAAGCDSGPPKPDQAPRPDRPVQMAPPRSSAESTSAGSPAGGSSARLPEDVPATGPAAAVGTWEGTFDAKKGTVHVGSEVKDKTRAQDDGKGALGEGRVHLAVAADGEVTGAFTGALGKDSIRGKIEVEDGRTMLRATALPEDLAARDAMSGILIGELKGDVIHAEIHVSAGDAVAVREATFDLRRK